ncbi:MAG: hypothetical protein KAZ36_00375 [Bacteroidales bacterium]|nr:hypothetical protein [Bacteroidales bacterium]
MAGIRFIINKDLQGRQDNAAARIMSNLAGAAAQASGTAAVQLVKQGIYDLILNPAYIGGNGEYRLSTDNELSPYTASDKRYPVRNNLIFEDNKRSVKILIWDVRIDTSFENTIVKTPVTKRRVTIKEYISAKDYSFTVSGSLIADSQFYFPLDELKEFIRLFEIEENFNVRNVFINAFDVHKVVLESANIPQSSAKFINAIPFNLKLISDQDVQLSIQEEGA